MMKKTTQKQNEARYLIDPDVINIRRFQILLFALILSLSLPSTSPGQYANPITGLNWFEETTLPTPRGSIKTCAVDGKIYVLGGYLAGTTFGIVEVYDPETGIWDTVAPMPTPRHEYGACVLNGKIHVYGGFTEWPGEAVSNMEVYDPTTDSWETGDTMPSPRTRHGIIPVDGKIYVIGGDLGESDRTGIGIVERYDPVSGVWDTCASMITARSNSCYSAIDGKINAIGGASWNGSSWIYESSLEVYEPAMDQWTKKSDKYVPGGHASSVVIESNIYVLGGGNGERAFSSVEVYDPAKDVWTSLPAEDNMPESRWGFGATVLDKTVYVTGGRGSGEGWPPVHTVYKWDLPIMRIGGKPFLTREDTMLAEIYEDCRLYAVPDGTPAVLDSIINDSIISWNGTAYSEIYLLLNDIPTGEYLVYGVGLDGRVDQVAKQFGILETVPELFIEVRDSETKEILNGSRVVINGRMLADYDGDIDMAGWIYDSCTVRVSKSGFMDFDTSLVVNSNTTLVVYLKHAFEPPELYVNIPPVVEPADLWEINMTQHGTIYITPESTPAVADSITEYAIESFAASANNTLIKSLLGIPPGTYRIFGISRLGRIAAKSYVVHVIDHFPECIVRVIDAASKEPVNSCLLMMKCPLMFDGHDTIPWNSEEFDLSGMVYDTCTLSVTKVGYFDFDTTLVVLSDTSYVINLVPKITESVLESAKQMIRIYPNPTQGLITIQTNEQEICSFKIISLSGQVIKSMDFSESQFQVDLSPFPSGIYLIRIVSGDTEIKQKVIKYGDPTPSP